VAPASGLPEATEGATFTTPEGVVTLPAASVRCQRLKNCQAAATAVRHVSIAAARSGGPGDAYRRLERSAFEVLTNGHANGSSAVSATPPSSVRSLNLNRGLSSCAGRLTSGCRSPAKREHRQTPLIG
jgi:hypothetical protein